MNIKKIAFVTVISFSVVVVLMALYSIFSVMPDDNPLEGSGQLVLVVSRTETSQKAMLQIYDRDGDTWQYKFSCPVVIGKNGMAWGLGLHKDSVRLQEETVKREGDGMTPKGVFELTEAYGYPSESMMNIKFPYTEITGDMICIDEARSEYYNMIVNEKDVSENSANRRMLSVWLFNRSTT